MKAMSRWLIKLSIVCLSVFWPVNNLSAQEAWEETLHQLAAEEDDNGRWESLYEELAEWREHPLNINAATKEQLEKFPFLSDIQIENILYYLYKHGDMLGSKELQMVEDLDRKTIGYLLPFITFEKSKKESQKLSLKQVMKYGRHELMTRLDVPLYTRKGYYTKYLGYGFYHNVRYNFRYSDKIVVGVTAEKDAAEPFFDGYNRKGYDYYSPYLILNNVGRFKTLALGNYRLSYGYGLVMNAGFSLGKSTMVSSMQSRASGIRKHSSTDEYNYFQGIAASYRLSNRWSLDAFYSYRQMDGTVDGRFITSLKKDGYHRVKTDFEKKNTVSNQLAGSHLYYNGKYYELGLTAVYNVFNRVLKSSPRTYNRFYPQGRDFFNAGLTYKFFWKRFILSGETALDKRGRIATLNVLTYLPNSETRILLLNRFYDMAYQSLYAKAMGEGSMVQNESGVYAGLETRLLKSFTLNAYADFFYFPWKKYQLSQAETTGFDGMVQLGYEPTETVDMFLRYRYKQKKKDYNPEEGDKVVLPYTQQKWRYQLSYQPSEEWLLKTTADYVWCGYSGLKASQGVLVAQSAGFRPSSFPLRIDATVAWFHTDDYASRISLYEKSLLYAFSVPSFYGRGMRFALQVHYTLGERLTFEAKYACTHYRDRDVIGTALEQIEGNTKNDLYFQLRWKF